MANKQSNVFADRASHLYEVVIPALLERVAHARNLLAYAGLPQDSHDLRSNAAEHLLASVYGSIPALIRTRRRGVRDRDDGVVVPGKRMPGVTDITWTCELVDSADLFARGQAPVSIIIYEGGGARRAVLIDHQTGRTFTGARFGPDSSLRLNASSGATVRDASQTPINPFTVQSSGFRPIVRIGSGNPGGGESIDGRLSRVRESLQLRRNGNFVTVQESGSVGRDYIDLLSGDIDGVAHRDIPYMFARAGNIVLGYAGFEVTGLNKRVPSRTGLVATRRGNGIEHRLRHAITEGWTLTSSLEPATLARTAS